MHNAGGELPRILLMSTSSSVESAIEVGGLSLDALNVTYGALNC